MLKDYLLERLVMLVVAVGIIDAVVKAFVPWNSLPSFIQGWTWHIFIFLVYLFFCWLISKTNKLTEYGWIGVVLLYGLEDLVYYTVKIIVTGKVDWNRWLPILRDQSTPTLYILLFGGSALLSILFFYLDEDKKQKSVN